MTAPEITELLPATHARPVTGSTLGRIALPAALVIVFIAASAGMSVWGYLIQRDEALQLADDLIAGLEQHIGAKVQGYLDPVARLARMSAIVVGADALSPSGHALTESFALGALGTHQQIAIASFADPDGNFLMYARQADGAIDTKRIERSAAGVTARWLRRRPDGTRRGEEQVPDDGYDPRTRPWYRGAIDAGTAYWSDVYIFFTSQQPGLTVSVPVADASGQVRAVYGLDITLANLSDFLSQLEIGSSGEALIHTSDGRLVAYHDLERMLRNGGDGKRPASIRELGKPVIERAFDRYRVEGHGRRILDVHGVRFLSSVASLRGVTGRDWSVMIVVPESDFTGVITSNLQSQLVASLCLAGVATLLAWLVARQSLAATRITRQVRTQQAELALRGDAFARLVSDPALGRAEDRDALTRMTDTVSDALGALRVSLWRWDDEQKGLLCEDCADRRSGGHTEGTHLKRSMLAGLAGELGEPLAIVDTASDSRSVALHDAYLGPLALRCLLSAPVLCDGELRALLWVEDDARDAAWARETLPFLIGIAGLLAGRYAPERAPRRAIQSTAPAPVVPASSGRELGGGPRAPDRYRHPLHAAGLLGERAGRLRDRAGGEVPVQLYPGVSVLCLLLDDPAIWSQSSPHDAESSLLDVLMREVDSRCDALGVDYAKVLGDRIVCAAGFGESADDAVAGASTIASLALDVDACCTRVLTALDQPLRFRAGLDTGPALGAAVGGENWVYNLWGDAVTGAEAMAASGVPGAVQVSETSYLLLREHHVLSPRGRYFVPDVGDTVTYLLLRRL